MVRSSLGRRGRRERTKREEEEEEDGGEVPSACMFMLGWLSYYSPV